MADAPLGIITSQDGANWTRFQNIVNGYSDYGLQMHVFRGEIYGIMVQTVQYPRQMFATKYKLGEGWRSFRSLPEKWLSQGRVSVTVLGDRFYVLRRGTDDAVYLCWTDDFSEWHDVGRIGSKYAKTMVSPAILAFDGKLYMAGVGEDSAIYYTIADIDGQRLTSWHKIDGTGTQSALAMAVYAGRCFLFHTGYKNTKFHYHLMTLDGPSKDSISVPTEITSGISAVSWKYNQLVVSYRGKDNSIMLNSFDGKKWLGATSVPRERMKYQTGLTTYGGRLILSFSTASSSSTLLGYRQPIFPDMLDEKRVVNRIREVEDDEQSEWQCKWDSKSNQSQPNKQGKSWVAKMFCL